MSKSRDTLRTVPGQRRIDSFHVILGLMLLTYGFTYVLAAQQPTPSQPDAVAQAQQTAPAAGSRPEQVKSAHDRSDVFDPPQARP